MQYTILTFENIHEHGTLFADLFRARKEAFIDKRRWDLTHTRGMEYDQYDTPASIWVAIHDGDEVFSGIRLTPTTHRVGCYTYMLKDAQDGKLEQLPTNVLFDEAPVRPDIWESSRVFVLDRGRARKLKAQKVLSVGHLAAARVAGAKKLIGISPASWPRWYPRQGLTAKGIGPMLPMSDGIFQSVEIDVTKSQSPYEKR